MARNLSNSSEPVQSVALEAATRLNNKEVDVKEEKRKRLADRYAAEEKVTVIGAPMYAPYFGDRMPIVLNGIPIWVPLDGNRYKIPESYAQVFNARINSVNEQLATQKTLSNVTANLESFPGQRDLIQRV